MRHYLVGLVPILLAASTAFCDDSRFYLTGDLGGALVPDVHATATRSISLGPHLTSGKIEFGPGARVGIAAGCALNNYLSAEAELGGFVSTVHGGGGRDWNFHDGTLANVPLLFNLKLQYPNRSRWTPFVGGGVGVAASILSATVFAAGGELQSFTRGEGTEADAVFAWQAFAGISYKVSDQNRIALYYRYLFIDEPAWDLTPIKLSTGKIETHALSIAFEHHF